jgi:2-aminoadipate transaminase
MTSNFSRHFAERTKDMKASEVRELLKLLQVPGMISFAGGFPNPETFPTELIRKIADDILRKDGSQALQYGITEGYQPLREAVANRMRKKGMDVSKDNVLITSGSQQVIDLMGKMFIDPGDIVMVSAPTYLAALTSFTAYQAAFESIPIDHDNMRMDLFEERTRKLARRGKPLKIVYVLPNFHNPAGVTMPEKNRKKLIDLASDYDLIVLEDDPYSELRYTGEPVPPIKSFDDEGRVVYMGTFSKILAPGLRTGWLLADPEILRKLVIAKQSTDVCTNVLSQRIAHEYIVQGHIEPQIEKIKKIYGRKLDIMLRGLDKYAPSEVKWVKPEGGMFLWVTLPETIDSGELLTKALKKRVAFVTGKAFYVDPRDGRNALRLNFTHPSDDTITEGLKRLGSVMNQELVSRWDKSEDGSLQDEIGKTLIGKP